MGSGGVPGPFWIAGRDRDGPRTPALVRCTPPLCTFFAKVNVREWI